MALKQEIKVWFWAVVPKEKYQILRYHRMGMWRPHNYNYIPIKGGVFKVGIKELSNKNRIAQFTHSKMGDGHFLIKGFTQCSRSRLKVKNRTLCEIKIEDIPNTDKFKITIFRIKAIKYYYWWKKSDMAIQQILDRGTTRKK